MPIFEFRCSACAHLEEVLQKHTEPPPEACPACGKTGTLAKELSLTSFQLKGGGWYKDLYASTKPGTSTDSAGGSSASDGTAKASSSTEKSPSEKPAAPAPAVEKPAAKKDPPASSGGSKVSAGAA